MASSEDSIRVYTTDTIVDNPGAEIVYKGLVICASNDHSDISDHARISKLTEEAQEEAKKLSANAIVGMKIMETYDPYEGLKVAMIGTAVYVSYMIKD